MEFNRIQPREVLAVSKLKKSLKYSFGTILFLGAALLALLIFIATYLPRLDSKITDLNN